jgi:hypothetical protein
VWGVSGLRKTSPACLAYRAPGEAPPATCPTYRARCRGYTVMCSCANRGEEGRGEEEENEVSGEGRREVGGRKEES